MDYVLSLFYTLGRTMIVGTIFGLLVGVFPIAAAGMAAKWLDGKGIAWGNIATIFPILVACSIGVALLGLVCTVRKKLICAIVLFFLSVFLISLISNLKYAKHKTH